MQRQLSPVGTAFLGEGGDGLHQGNSLLMWKKDPHKSKKKRSASKGLILSSVVFLTMLGWNSKWLYFASSLMCGDTSGLDKVAARDILVFPYLRRSFYTPVMLHPPDWKLCGPDNGVSTGHIRPDS